MHNTYYTLYMGCVCIIQVTHCCTTSMCGFDWLALDPWAKGHTCKFRDRCFRYLSQFQELVCHCATSFSTFSTPYPFPSSLAGDLVKLNMQTPMYRIVKAMAAKDSALEVKDRTWLKMTIPNSFIGGYKIIFSVPPYFPQFSSSILCHLFSLLCFLGPCMYMYIHCTLTYIGSELVDWLNSNVEGFLDRRHARKYAALMLKVHIQ